DGTGLLAGRIATGWFQVGNDWYRAETDGTLNFGTLEWGSEGKYFFDKITGKSLFSIRKSGKTYYGYGPGGSDATLIHGFYEFDGKKYYFGKKDDGSGLAEGQMATGSRMIDGKAYYFNNDGIEEKHEFAGFQTINGKTYYFGKKEDGTGLAEGERARWTVNINGKWHYFSGDGSAWAANSWLADYNQAGKPNTWYILEKGEMASGFKQIDGKTYYFDPNNRCRMSTGFQTIEGKQYYFGQNGDGSGLAKGQMASGFHTIHGKIYYFGKDGQVKKGIHSVGDDRYFLDNATGECIFSIQQRGYSWIGYAPDGSTPIVGFKEFGGNKYHFNKKDPIRSLEEGELSLGMPLIDDKYYYFSTEPGLERGKMLTGFQGQNSGGITKLYYFDPAAKDGVLTGFHAIGGNKYYFGEMDGPLELGLGEMAIGVQIIGGKRYEFEVDGRLKS
ncbi:N-acetylmuramoyl-L-alanine amidase family protein, partial [Bacillus mycoides]|uniref:N-acetylmuramoyl-L-alanine amidase family protein n=1 Tax=Bacillus mycoides TaxID=1405 RepID=UPI003827FC78